MQSRRRWLSGRRRTAPGSDGAQKNPGKKPLWQLSRLGQIAIGSPEEGGAHGNGIVAIGVVEAVIINALGGRGYVLGLQVDPLRQLVAGEADPRRVLVNKA